MENEQKLFLGGRRKVPYLFQKNLFSIEILFLALLVYRSKHTKVADRRWKVVGEWANILKN